MRKFILFAASLLTASVLFAQEDPCAKTRYQINKFGDNLFLGVAGGINGLQDPDNDIRLTGEFEVNLGKWISPAVGLRLGYQGFTLKENFDGDYRHHYSPIGTEGVDGKVLVKYGFSYFHGDLMWNLVNAFSKDKKEHIFNIAPYLHAGYVHLYETTEGFFSKCQDNEFGAGPGLFMSIRLVKHLDLTLDARDIFFSGRFHDWNDGGPVQAFNAAAGLQVTFGKTGWDKGVAKSCYDDANAALSAARAALDDANNALASANADRNALNDRIKALNDEIKSLRDSKNKVVVENKMGIIPLNVYFDIDKAKLVSTERRHLVDYVRYIMSNDPDFTFYLTGSADKGTGKYDYNTKLAARRAKTVKDILVNELNVPEDHIVVKDGQVSDVEKEARFDRAVHVNN